MIVKNRKCLLNKATDLTALGSYFTGLPAFYKFLHITLHSLMNFSAIVYANSLVQGIQGVSFITEQVCGLQLSI
jgi:hypothetical protein